MDDCIFCKITTGKLPCNKIYEDKNSLAFLDIKPILSGQTLVIPKKHYSSDFRKVDDQVLSDLILVAKKVARKIDKALNTRCCLVIEGFDIDHIHIKLYPTTHENHLLLTSSAELDKINLERIAKLINN